MDPNPWPYGASFGDLPSLFPSAMTGNTPDFSSQESTNIGSDQDVSFLSDLGYTDYSPLHSSVAPISNDPLMEIVHGATSSSLGQTLRATDNSSGGTYMRYSREDVAQMILAIDEHGTRVEPISNNLLMEIVQAATSSSLGQTHRATDNSSRRTYKKFSREDVEELILAVLRNGTCWKSIAEIPRFKEKGRTDLQLLNKWRHMTETDDDKKDPKMKDLYDRAKDVKRIRGEMN